MDGGWPFSYFFDAFEPLKIREDNNKQCWGHERKQVKQVKALGYKWHAGSTFPLN